MIKEADVIESLEKKLEDPEFKAEYDALEPEYEFCRLLLDARTSKNYTQKQLADITGMAQADISRLERGEGNPSLKTMERLASATGHRLVLRFE